jgi:hypothetical protein
MTRLIRPIRIEGDVAYVTLTKGYEAIIDAADVPLVEGFNWCSRADGLTFYAARTDYSSGKKTVRMHRVIMNCSKGFEIDHIDGDGLNNRRSNMRLSTHAENMRNRRIAKNNTSGFKGVAWDKNGAKWRAKIKVDGEQIHLGQFDTPEAAHAAYVAASEKLHGEFARAA